MTLRPRLFDDAPRCDDAVARAHLEAFIASFVEPPFRERAHLLLVERQQRGDAMRAIPRWVDPRRLIRLDGDFTRPASITTTRAPT